MRFFEGGTRLRARDVAVAERPLRSLDLGMRWEKDRFTLTPDSRIEAWGGALTGGGTMDVRDGRWQLNLCADGLALGPLLAPLSEEPLLPDDILAATMSTSPSTRAQTVWPRRASRWRETSRKGSRSRPRSAPRSTRSSPIR